MFYSSYVFDMEHPQPWPANWNVSYEAASACVTCILVQRTAVLETESTFAHTVLVTLSNSLQHRVQLTRQRYKAVSVLAQDILPQIILYPLSTMAKLLT